MDTVDAPSLGDTGLGDARLTQLGALGDAFAFRAEWLGERLFSYYREPGYLREILDLKPCLLVGGRGTGKTTVLKSIAYEGKWRLERGSSPPERWPFVGMYWLIDTNQVGALVGDEVSQHVWVKVFAHYVNLTLCTQLVRYVMWHNARSTRPIDFDCETVSGLANSLHLEEAKTVEGLAASLRKGLDDFNARVNNIGDMGTGRLSLQGAPIRTFIEAMRGAGITDQQRVFFLVDEFENLLDYQQRVINTLIKHGGDLYSFKVAMKSNGHRDRRTINLHESLQEPADYVTIDIAERLMEREYSRFASSICNERIASLLGDSVNARDVEQLFPPLSESQEAELLGVQQRVERLRHRLVATAERQELERFDALSPLHQYLIEFWARGHATSEVDCLRELLAAPDLLAARLANYQYAMLFTIHQGVRGINKYYAGWATYLRMSQGNLRYLLQLVHEALRLHLEGGSTLSTSVAADVQTRAAQNVGRTNLADLKGLDSRGADLTRLVLSLGRVFQVMARRPHGHAPEACQFQVSAASHVSTEAVLLLEAAVANLALIRFVSNKMAGASGEVKDYDYAVHPIFSAFFEFSYRKKRRIKISDHDILGCVKKPRETIEKLLRNSAPFDADSPRAGLPEQLEFFGGYYDSF